MKQYDNNINPDKVTKPIQLLAVWLSGLVIIVSSFLTAAIIARNPPWLSALFAIAAVVFVPLFLLMVFLLQTKFRPEMQEDHYYSDYLQTMNQVTKKEAKEEEIKALNDSVKSLKEELISITKENKTQFELLKGIIDSKDKPVMKEKIIDEINTALEKPAILEKNNSKIQLNDLLSNYEKVKDIITQNGFNINSTFGSTSTPPTFPKRFTLSYDDSSDLNSVKKLIKLLYPLGLKYLDSMEKKMFGDTIYIGSYAYEFSENLYNVNPKLIKALDKINTFEDLEAYLQNNCL